MVKNISSAEWENERGKKWQAQFSEMEAMLSPLDKPLIEALKLDEPYRIADVGCGAGGTTLKIQKLAPLKSVVHGFDISKELIESAKGRIPSDNKSITFNVMNVAAEYPVSAPYDRLTSRFGVMFFDDPSSAFSNLADWLKPGGRFAFSVWAPVTENSWVLNVREAISQVIALPKSDPDAPGPFRYADGDKLLSLLMQAGFKGLDTYKWQGVLPVGGGLKPTDAASFALKAFSIGDLLNNEKEKTKQKAHEILSDLYSRHQQDGVVQAEASTLIVTGIV